MAQRFGRRRLLATGGALTITALAVACSRAAPPGPGPAPAKPAEARASVLKINLVSASEAPQTLAVRDMAEEIKQKSGGTFDVQVYANSELGSNADNVEQAARGSTILT